MTSKGWLHSDAANRGMGEPDDGRAPLHVRIKPSAETLERIRFIDYLVEEYGPEAVAEWQDPPISIEEWRRKCSLESMGG